MDRNTTKYSWNKGGGQLRHRLQNVWTRNVPNFKYFVLEKRLILNRLEKDNVQQEQI